MENVFSANIAPILHSEAVKFFLKINHIKQDKKSLFYVVKQQYAFKLVQKSILPTLSSSYTHMDIIVDSVKHMFETIEEKYMFMDYRELLKPTVTLVKCYS
ncbi:hypothetical protein BCV71DRAFT_239393 [Rhizopus microsporus]|uniref:Uncharacterized protein n=1 Tax=Rhizopus microsporus TaxID=58291 RepID=A0A1X0RMR1_RHIZD|nr:hypothetical protein BCV71DRAFT_239393 [Rhizopus microsporus]